MFIATFPHKVHLGGLIYMKNKLILLLFLILVVSVGTSVSVYHLMSQGVEHDKLLIPEINTNSGTASSPDIISIREPRRAFLLGFGERTPNSIRVFRVYVLDQYGDVIQDTDITWSLDGYVEGDRIYFYPWGDTMGVMLHIGENEEVRELVVRATSTVNPLVYDLIFFQVSPDPYAHRVQVGEQIGILREGRSGTTTIPLITQNMCDESQYAMMILPMGITLYNWDLLEQGDNRFSIVKWLEIVNGMYELTFLYDGTLEAGTWDVFLGVGRANILFTLTIEPAND